MTPNITKGLKINLQPLPPMDDDVEMENLIVKDRNNNNDCSQ